jgi:hypothetical protein
MEQIAVLGIIITLSILLSLIGLIRLRRAHRRQNALSAAFLRARHGRDHQLGG